MSFLEPGKDNLPGQKYGDWGNLLGNAPAGGKFTTPTMPTPPDYKSLIDEQGKQNRINQTTPYGNLTFKTDPKTGQVSANYAQDPQDAALQDQLMHGESSILGQGNFKQGNFGGQIRQDEQNQYNDAMKLMQPQLDQQQAQLTQNMADRGLPIGSEIQQNSQGQFDASKNNLMTNAAMQAMGMGQQEQQQMFGQQLQGYNANQATLGSLFNMSNNMPGLKDFFSPTGIDVNGAAGLANSAAQQNYAQQMQQYGSNMGGLYGLGGSAIGALFSSGGA